MKKYSIQDQAKYAENKILEDNADFYNKVQTKHFAKKAANNRILFLRVGSLAVAALVLVICLSVIMTKVLDDNNEKHYLLQNEENAFCDLSEVNDNLNNAFLDLDANEYDFQVTKIYDSVSGDNLYFLINIVGIDYFENIKMWFFTNPYYEQFVKLSGDVIQATKVGSLDVSYKEVIFQDADGLFNFNYAAQLNDNKTVVYIEYEQLWYENSSNFFSFLEKAIKNK